MVPASRHNRPWPSFFQSVLALACACLGGPNGMFEGGSVFGPGGFNGGKPLMPDMGPGSDFANSFGQGFPFTGPGAIKTPSYKEEGY